MFFIFIHTYTYYSALRLQFMPTLHSSRKHLNQAIKPEQLLSRKIDLWEEGIWEEKRSIFTRDQAGLRVYVEHCQLNGAEGARSVNEYLMRFHY